MRAWSDTQTISITFTVFIILEAFFIGIHPSEMGKYYIFSVIPPLSPYLILHGKT